MLKLYIPLFLCLVGLVYSDQGVNWVLLVAGSNEYYNYRHQADICHAYQIVHKNGIPDERIIVMMYDDIANNEENPTKGIIINKPKGPNVYNGTLKDYTKTTVTPNNFLNILQGIETDTTKKVIKSGPNDTIFVYFADHGAPGLVAFPDGSALHAKSLNSAIKNMHIQKKYNKMVLYVEACESGSMFDNLLPENINVYATTAANPDESSYACYYDETRNTYLGDLYSVNWLEDSDKGHINNETLFKQFQIVKKLTNTSHVMEYGNLTIGKTNFVGQFISEKSSFVKQNDDMALFTPKFDAVKTEDVRMSILQKKLRKENNFDKKNKILAEIEKANYLKRIASNTIKKIATAIAQEANLDASSIIIEKTKLSNYNCYQEAVDHLIEKCFNLNNEYVLRNLYVLVNLCESGIKSEKINQIIDKVCPVKYSN
jgi:legumain